ncbi:hypothetical protein GCM10028822_37950 [Hymenobacter terrigena]
MNTRKLPAYFWLKLLAFGLLAGCKKEEPAAPVTPPVVVAPATGSATGTISPAGAVVTVTATSAAGVVYTVTPAAGTGAFTLSNLPGGNYTLTFAPATGFAAPAAQPLAITASTATLVGTVAVAVATSSIVLQFNPVMDGAPLVLNGQAYTRANGQQLRVTTFNYYCSNVRLLRADGSAFVVPNSYYLVSAAAPASQSITIAGVPVGSYTGLSFVVGVDSARNVSGAQTGALDPSNGMFWTWNSGYIFLKMEGLSPQAPHAAGVSEGALVFHIGGFQQPNNTLRTVSPSFGISALVVREAHLPEVQYKVDVLKMFDGPNPINFSSLNNVMGGSSALPIASNYAAGMFEVVAIHPN